MTSDFEGNVSQDLKEGNYFIIDWVKNNPMNPSVGIPVVIVANATIEDLKKIESGETRIPNPTIGATQRILLKIEKINKI